MNLLPSVFRINQTGYRTGFPVFVSVLSDDPVRLIDDSGCVIREFSAKASHYDAASGDPVTLLNLGILHAGEYWLESGGAARKINVSDTPWASVVDSLIKGLYFQRCGCELIGRYAGKYVHPACHTAAASEWDNRSAVRFVTGGWHDAGDYGKYVGPGAVTVGHLLYAWKLFPDGCSDMLNIPESGNGIPDILNEARYELAWLLQMQHAGGAFHHKLTKARFAPFIMPQEDRETEYLMPISHCATGAACACLALASRVYQTFDPSFSNQMLLASQRAWHWMETHPDFVPFRNPEGVRTGQYGDKSDHDERFWAACELFAATGNEKYLEAVEKLYAAG